MVDDKCHTLSEKRAYDTHLVACAEGYGCESVVGDVLELEVTRIVEEAYVDTSGVGRIMVYNLQVPFAELGLPDYVFHDGAVFDFDEHPTFSVVASGSLSGENVTEPISFSSRYSHDYRTEKVKTYSYSKNVNSVTMNYAGKPEAYYDEIEQGWQFCAETNYDCYQDSRLDYNETDGSSATVTDNCESERDMRTEFAANALNRKPVP